MTNEEAIEILQSGAGIWPMTDRANNALNKAIKALEQEPCEDVISRQAVDEAIYDYSRSCDVNYAQIMEYIDDLPSVTPKQRTGHWIMSDDGLYRPICNNCGAHPWKGYIPTVEEATEVFKYCPNCGAKMESEGQA